VLALVDNLVAVVAPGGGPPDSGEMPLVWTIDAAVSSGLDLDLDLCYTDDQLGSLVEDDLEIYRDGGSGWTNMGGTVDSGANCVTLTGVTDLSDWTLATELPIGTRPKFYVYLPMILKE
jgi:hypothetical protein